MAIEMVNVAAGNSMRSALDGRSNVLTVLKVEG